MTATAFAAMDGDDGREVSAGDPIIDAEAGFAYRAARLGGERLGFLDRKSTRLNSSHT